MDDAQLTQALMRPAAYPHAARDVQLVETHISRVFLADGFAYKLRKPVHLDFVDFSSLAARRQDCETELRLNRRLAPALYLGLSTVVRGDTMQAVRVDAAGEVLDYAVKMRTFPQQALFSALLKSQQLLPAHIDTLALLVADFHRAQPPADRSAGFGTPARIAHTLDVCLNGLQRLDNSAGLCQLGDTLRALVTSLTPAFESRLRHGRVRECHGDLHLGNVVLLDDQVTPFDCLEFDPALRWIDTISDLAFPFVDLLNADRSDLAYRLLNVYFEQSGDYTGLAMLPFYASMRALVSARIVLERAVQGPDASEATLASARTASREWLALAQRLTIPRTGALVLMHGLSGSGKSTAAADLVENSAMLRVRADVERKRLRRHEPHHGNTGWYGPAETERTYRRLRAICRIGCLAGFPMIADASFLKRRYRDCFTALAHRLDTQLSIVACEADLATLRRRIEARAHLRSNVSDADLAVLEQQRQTLEPLGADELAHVVKPPRNIGRAP